MDKQKKIDATLRLAAAIVGGYSSQEHKMPCGLGMDSWKRLFENCYDAVGVLTKVAEEKPN